MKKLLLPIFALAAFFPPLLNSIRNPLAFEKYFGINSEFVFFIFVLIIIALRFRGKFNFGPVFNLINTWVIFPLATAISVGLSWWGYVTPPNYVYSLLGINYDRVFFLALGSLVFIFVGKTNAWWRENWKRVIFFSALLMLLVLWVVRLWPYDYFLNMVLEDHFVEWGQFWVILAAGGVALMVSQRLWKRQMVLGIIYLILGLIATFVAGDEISWGQRLLGFETPEKIAVNNYQQEFTLHNLTVVAGITWLGYLYLSWYGAVSWLPVHFMPKKLREMLGFFTPPWFVAGYYLASFAYQIYANPVLPNAYREWSEPAELMLYLGIFFFFLNSYIIARRLRRD